MTHNEIIKKVVTDFLPINSGWEDLAFDWIIEGLEEIGTTLPLERLSVAFKSINKKIKLCCSIEKVLGIVVNGKKVHIKNGVCVNPDTSAKDYGKLTASYNFPYITFDSKNEIEGELHYLGFPIDECGDLLIPDIIELKEALMYKVVFKLLLRGEILNINILDAKNMWDIYRSKATNALLMSAPDFMTHNLRKL